MFNKIDKNIINALYDNASLSNDEIAKMLNVSRGTIRNRLIKLEQEGIIKNYSIRARLHKIDLSEAIVGLDIMPEEYINALDSVSKLDFVKEVYRTSGDHSALIMIITNSDEIKDKIQEINKVKGIRNTYPSFIQEIIK
jgi:DNA-binding Lrp family transcriptional regulator